MRATATLAAQEKPVSNCIDCNVAIVFERFVDHAIGNHYGTSGTKIYREGPFCERCEVSRLTEKATKRLPVTE